MPLPYRAAAKTGAPKKKGKKKKRKVECFMNPCDLEDIFYPPNSRGWLEPR
jgi:hypothetical protein